MLIQNKIVNGAKIYCLFLVFYAALIAHQAIANDKSDMQRLYEIQTLSDRDNAVALAQLQAFKKALPADAGYAVKLETLKILVSLYYDAGQIKSSDATIDEFLKLTKAHNDPYATALARISDSYRLLEASEPERAIEQLKQVGNTVRPGEDPEVTMRLNTAFGVMYRNAGEFELSLKHFLLALDSVQFQPRRKIESRIYKLDALASLYIVMKDPEKALATSNEALLLSSQVNAPKIVASLSVTQGSAFTLMGKYDDALKALTAALKISAEAGMSGMESTVLANIADHYLLLHDYKRAEEFSRKTIAKAASMNDLPNLAVGQINLGLAIGGQGKVRQGAQYINEGLIFFEKSDAKADIEIIVGELANMYEAAGQYQDALAVLRRQQKLSNALFSSDRSRAVATLQEQFNAGQRQKQIELLAKENALKDADIRNQRLQQMVTLLGAILTVIAGLFIFLLYRRVRKVNAKLLQANTQLEFHAIRDPLTGLYNRRSFVELMGARLTDAEAERREAQHGNPDCLILMDIDLFKHINDTWGHAAGDRVLTEIASRLKSTVRDTDMVLRWGGEEFLIYSPHSSPVQITSLVDRVLRAIGENPVLVGELHIPVTLTAGFISLPVSGVPETVCSWEKTLQIADMALYLGKAHGRNRAYGLARLLVPYEQAMPILERDLSAAISAGLVEMIEVNGPLQVKDTSRQQPDKT
jgi:diguanylate cyclase (GGDEF)-like protein